MPARLTTVTQVDAQRANKVRRSGKENVPCVQRPHRFRNSIFIAKERLFDLALWIIFIVKNKTRYITVFIQIIRFI